VGYHLIVVTEMKNFARLQAVMYAKQIVISWKRCKRGMVCTGD